MEMVNIGQYMAVAGNLPGLLQLDINSIRQHFRGRG